MMHDIVSHRTVRGCNLICLLWGGAASDSTVILAMLGVAVVMTVAMMLPTAEPSKA
jgi:predicted metal-binding membrane protein